MARIPPGPPVPKVHIGVPRRACQMLASDALGALRETGRRDGNSPLARLAGQNLPKMSRTSTRKCSRHVRSEEFTASAAAPEMPRRAAEIAQQTLTAAIPQSPSAARIESYWSSGTVAACCSAANQSHPLMTRLARRLSSAASEVDCSTANGIAPAVAPWPTLGRQFPAVARIAMWPHWRN